METPLTLTVAINEVLISWVSGWHEHISRERDVDQRDKTHLARAITKIEDLLEERIVAGSRFVEGRLSGDGNPRPGEGIPGDWKVHEIHSSHGKPVSILVRSWRGTYDEDWHSL